MHRDLKPKNIMISKDNKITIIDFGVSKVMAPSDKTKTFAFTEAFAAPDVLKRDGYDMSIDIWALGIILFNLFTGYTPFEKQNDQYVCLEIIKEAENMNF